MKRMGLLGGMSWESSREYYRLLNEMAAGELGGLHSADIIMRSFDFGPLAEMLAADDFTGLGRTLGDAAVELEAAGAGLVAICTNTMHLVADEVAARVGVPVVHLVRAVADEVAAMGMDRVALLGTAMTMERPLYGPILADAGIEVIVPDAGDRALVHRVIFEELCLGRVEDASRRAFLKIVEEMAGRGAQGVILGCTEIPLLLPEGSCPVPTFDTTRIHCRAIFEAARG